MDLAWLQEAIHQKIKILKPWPKLESVVILITGFGGWMMAP